MVRLEMGRPDAVYGVCFPKQPEMFSKGALFMRRFIWRQEENEENIRSEEFFSITIWGKIYG